MYLISSVRPEKAHAGSVITLNNTSAKQHTQCTCARRTSVTRRSASKVPSAVPSVAQDLAWRRACAKDGMYTVRDSHVCTTHWQGTHKQTLSLK